MIFPLSETRSSSPYIKRLLFAVLALLAFLSGGTVQAQTTESVIDVAVFYTPATKTAQSWTTKLAAETAVQNLVTQTNMAYTASGVHQRIKLVAVEEVTYTEDPSAAEMTEDLVRLALKSDGFMDGVHAIRDRTGADIVMLLRSEKAGTVSGTAYTMSEVSTTFASSAFGVSIVNAATFAHELGHVMGLRHDRHVSCRPECLPRTYPYAYGYVNQEAFKRGAPASKRWRTIMSYDLQCTENTPSFSCTRLLRFSNPRQTHLNDPLGVALTSTNGSGPAVDGPADAVRALNNTRNTVANFLRGPIVEVSFDAATYTVTEGGTVTVTVELNTTPGRELVIPLTATSTNGAWIGDYSLPMSVTFSATETERTVTFSAVQDSRQEDEETVSLGFGARLPARVIVGSQATATVTVTDNDTISAAPSVSTVALISDSRGGYAAGEEIAVAVVFTKPITVTGIPNLGLYVESVTSPMVYQADRSAGEVLVFTYTVAAGQRNDAGVSLLANSLRLPDGVTIKDSVNQDATLTHDAIEATSAHAVDGIAPTMGVLRPTVDDNTVTLAYNEALDERSVPTTSAFTVTVGGATATPDAVRLSGRTATLSLASRVAHDQTVTLSYTPGTRPLRDVAGNPAPAFSGRSVTNNTPEPIYDTDDDGLIAITTLAQLDAMRHDLDGDGLPTPAGASAYAAAFPNVTRVVCGTSHTGCGGYELLADLDFDTDGNGRMDADDAYWNSGAGWQPIGTNSTPFGTTFKGNDHTVRNLFIDRRTNIGLFGSVGSSGVIRQVGVVDVDVAGDNVVGGLVGYHGGTITASHATGRIEGRTNRTGGLVGRNGGTITFSYATGRVTGSGQVGGLAGWNDGGTVTFSYATGRVTGSSQVGGLAGWNDGGTITTSYATGSVAGSSQVGGLAGWNDGGTITASYATGPVTGSTSVGGLVGLNNGLSTSIIHSYWDTGTSGQTTSNGGSGKTTAELQTPTDASGIYANWDAAQWDFGTSSQYPALGGDSWQEFGHQLRAGPTSLAVTTTTGLMELSWTAVSPTAWSPAPDVTYTVYRTTGSTVTAVAEDLTASAYTDRTVRGGTTYTYQVAAVVDGGEATWSAPGAEVTAPNQPPAFDDGDSTTRTITENTTGNIGAPVAATDPDDTSLTYSLSGTDADSFAIISTTGQLRTATGLDHETQSRYEVTVSVRDSKATDGAADMVTDDTIAVTIVVSNVNEPPTFPETTPTTYPVDEGTPDKTNIGAPVTATDPENDTLTYRLSGTDAASFTLVPTTGQLQTRAALDYETKTTYRVTVEVRDDPADTRPDATRAVTIMVTNVDEPGMVELSSGAPQEKQTVTAMVSDLDGIWGSVTWAWARSPNRSTWTDITTGVSSSGTTSRYTPQTADVGQYLRATATYMDGTGTQRTEAATTTDPVLTAPKVSLVLSSDSIAEQGGVSTVTATLDRAVNVATRVTVTATAESPAVAGDFRQSGATLTIPANKIASEGAVVTVTARDNAVDGPDSKAVSVTGSVPATALVTAPNAVTLTITDDDERGVTVSKGELSIREHNEGETPAKETYTVVLASEPTDTVTIDVESGDEKVSVDLPSLTFTTGTWRTVKTVTVTTTPDADATNETATITHTVSGGDYGDNNVQADSVMVTVTDDESPSTAVTLRVRPKAVRERTSPWTVTVTGTLNGATEDTDIDVTLSVAADTATVDTDFTVANITTLTIAADTKSGTATFRLTAKDDDLHERDETVTVSGAATGTSLAVNPAKVTIEDADGPPTIIVTLDEETIEEGDGETTLTARLSHASVEATEVTVTERPDAFTPSPNPLTIAAEETEGTVTLTAADNQEDEADRRVPVTWTATNPLGVSVPPGSASALTLTITDDDPPPVSGPVAPRYMERTTRPVATYAAVDLTGRGLTWTVTGPDATAFTIGRTSGVVRFAQAPDYEAKDNYNVTVEATDAHGVKGSLDIAVTVEDRPGTVKLSSSVPRVGSALTATLSDPDQVDTVTEWRWERSIYDDFPAGDTTVVRTSTTDNATDTYTPGADDIEHYLRATVSYTDGQGTSKTVSYEVVADTTRKVSRSGGGGSSGGGGGGGPACADDRHGNSPAQATDLALSVETTGAICPAADVDYFTVTAPGQGLLFVDTSGGGQLRGTIWQHDVVLATGPTGNDQQPDRLGARVAAGPVVVAVQGQGGATGTYSLTVTFIRGHLENPGPDSFQSGVSVLSGWVCDAHQVEIELGTLPSQVAAYGTERLDTAAVCGDTDNGFGLLFNWNLLGDGEHEVVAYVDGIELEQATVTVTTLGEEFVRDGAGECVVEDFPLSGETATLVWQQNSQNFVIAGGTPPTGAATGRASGLTGVLENPGPNAFQSGIGVLSGWVCEAETVELEIGTAGRQVAAYGTERFDTAAVCGDTDNGFGLLFNWNLLGDGEHEVVAFVDDVELGYATVRVTTLGQEFLRGAEGECVVEDFPGLGQSVLLEWQQTSQNFVITEVE